MMVYQPMLELLCYPPHQWLQELYRSSGGGIEFMRPWTEEIYDIPPEQVTGSCSNGPPPARDRALQCAMRMASVSDLMTGIRR
jgi:hypothetical protein